MSLWSDAELVECADDLGRLGAGAVVGVHVNPQHDVAGVDLRLLSGLAATFLLSAYQRPRIPGSYHAPRKTSVTARTNDQFMAASP